MKRFFTEKKFSTAHMVFVMVFTILCITVTTYAVSVPNTFTSGTTAKASEVNANFQALETAVTTLEGDVITAVNSGSGLSGGGSSGDVTLSIPTGAVTNSMLAGSISPSKISGTAWTSTNDGAGSGLNADMVDGQNASSFITSESQGLEEVVTIDPRTYQHVYIDNQLDVSVASGYGVRSVSDNSGTSACVNCGAIRAETTTGQAAYVRTADANSYGLRVRNTGGNKALYVDGNIDKSGTNNFLIDHPLDPQNKLLRHASVESPDVIDLYKGRGQLVNGSAVIYLPDYFDALNKLEGREINLTPINGWSPLYLDGEISSNSFVVRTTPDGNQYQEFSWVIMADRGDPYTVNNPIVVEEEKGVNNAFEKGECIHPEACND